MNFSENVVVVETNYHSFIIFQSREGLTSFNKDNSANFSYESKAQLSFLGCLVFEITRKKIKSNLVFIVVLVLES